MIQEYQIRILPEQAASEEGIKRYLAKEKELSQEIKVKGHEIFFDTLGIQRPLTAYLQFHDVFFGEPGGMRNIFHGKPHGLQVPCRG